MYIQKVPKSVHLFVFSHPIEEGEVSNYSSRISFLKPRPSFPAIFCNFSSTSPTEHLSLRCGDVENLGWMGKSLSLEAGPEPFLGIQVPQANPLLTPVSIPL